MSLKSTFGLDGVELGIQVVVTAIVLGFAASFNRPDEARSFAALTLVASLFAERLLARPAEQRAFQPERES